MEDLARRLQTGDKEAFGIVYKDFNRYLYAIAMKYLNYNVEDIEDVLHDTFVWLWEHRYNIPDKVITDDKAFKKYLGRIAKNHSVDRVRSLRTDRRKREGSTYFKDDVYQPGFDNIELAEALDKALCNAGIPTRGKDIFLLHYEGGMKVQDIATHYGIQYQVAKNQISRALFKLRKYLRPMLK